MSNISEKRKNYLSKKRKEWKKHNDKIKNWKANNFHKNLTKLSKMGLDFEVKENKTVTLNKYIFNLTTNSINDIAKSKITCYGAHNFYKLVKGDDLVLRKRIVK